MLTIYANGGRTAGAAEGRKADGWKPLCTKGFGTSKIGNLTFRQKYATISTYDYPVLKPLIPLKNIKLYAKSYIFERLPYIAHSTISPSLILKV